MPVEKIKERLVHRLQTYYAEVLDIRNKYLFDTLLTDGIPTISRINEFDRQVFECFDSMFAGNNSGLTNYTHGTLLYPKRACLKRLREG